MDDNVHKLCELTKTTYAMSEWALGTNNYENNPLYEKLEQMMKVVEHIRLDDVSKRMTELRTDLNYIGYTVEDKDTVNFILRKFLFQQLQRIYKLIESYIENPKVHLVLDDVDYDTINVVVDDRELILSVAQIFEIQELVRKSYEMELQFKV